MTDPRLLNGEAIRHPLPSGLIHDLRSPLNLIIGYSEMLIEQAREQGQEDFVPDLEKLCRPQTTAGADQQQLSSDPSNR